MTENLSKNDNLAQITKDKTISAIINLAALLGSSDYDNNYKVNAQGVQNLMELGQKLGITRFIQISSVVVLKPIKGPYGVTKLKGEEFLTQSNFDYTVFIPAMILGPESMGLNRVLKNVFRIPLIVPIIGSGKQTQHPVFVEDFAKYIVKSVNEPGAFRKTYQIAGDRVISFKDFILLILKIKKKKKLFIPIPPWLAKMLGWFFSKTQKIPLFTAEHVKGVLQDSNLNTSEIKKYLNFEPTPLAEALEYSLEKIGNNWDYYLKPRNEQVKQLN
ncbi:MAG: NAD-dependent epimerase/dehydratase family protein [Bacteroidales bacterium]|nr:NAD-dependent epimerase/dehydratase family protein [Bacteroidales bacterium]